MSDAKKTAFALIVWLAAAATAEWGRVRGWFEDLKPVKQWAVAVAAALFVAICTAVVIVPLVWEWIQYLS